MGIGTSSTSSTYSLYLNKGVYAQSRIDATIYYDTNDTSYYLDPNTTSDQALRIRGGALHGPNPTWGKYLLVGGDGRQNRVDDSNVASVCTTNGNLHMDAASGYQMYLNYYDGTAIYFGGGAYNNWGEWSGGILYSYGQMRATIYYDYNNTGYYSDPNGDSRLSAIYLDQGYNYGWWRNYDCTGLYNQSYGRGIWAAECGGNSYGNYTTYDGGRNGWAGWGINSRWVFMGRGGDCGWHDNSRSWVMYANGGGEMYLYWSGNERMSMQSYGVYVNNDIRSPIFYDHNTGYYGDFNSTSRMYRINANQLYAYEWVYSEGNVIAYYSDERLKTKVGKIENPLEKVSQLNGFYYVNNDLAKSVGYTDEKVQLGLSAQDVQRILPEIVTLAPFDTKFDSEGKVIGSKSGENYLTIDYDKLVPLLVEAIKEQQTIIDKQRDDITEIKEMLKILTGNK